MHRASDIRSLSRSLGRNCLLLNVQQKFQLVVLEGKPTREVEMASFINKYIYMLDFTNVVNPWAGCGGSSLVRRVGGVGYIHGYVTLHIHTANACIHLWNWVLTVICCIIQIRELKWSSPFLVPRPPLPSPQFNLLRSLCLVACR